MPAEERRPAEKAAAVISILGSERASEVFRYLTENEVEQLSMEITRLPRLAEDELEDIAKDFYNCCVTEKVITEGGRDYAKEVLEKKIGSSSSEETMEVGGLNYIADVMNHVDRSTERDIFDELNMKNPQLAEDVRKLMFVFEDIAYLDPLSVQRFLREIDSKDLSVALKVANRDVTATIFSNMSNRMRESIQSDMEYLHNIRMSDVEEAQQRIVAVIRRLEEEGEIVISKDGKDEIIV